MGDGNPGKSWKFKTASTFSRPGKSWNLRVHHEKSGKTMLIIWNSLGSLFFCEENEGKVYSQEKNFENFQENDQNSQISVMENNIYKKACAKQCEPCVKTMY